MKMAQLPPLIMDRLYRSTAASPAATDLCHLVFRDGVPQTIVLRNTAGLGCGAVVLWVQVAIQRGQSAPGIGGVGMVDP